MVCLFTNQISLGRSSPKIRVSISGYQLIGITNPANSKILIILIQTGACMFRLVGYQPIENPEILKS